MIWNPLAAQSLQAELERRKKEWTLEDEVADAEVVEVEKQEVVNEIKTQQVEKKHKNIENEILRSEQAYEVLSEKFTKKYSPFEGCSLDKDTQWNIRLSGLGCIENKSNVKVVLFVSYVARKGND